MFFIVQRDLGFFTAIGDRNEKELQIIGVLLIIKIFKLKF